MRARLGLIELAVTLTAVTLAEPSHAAEPAVPIDVAGNLVLPDEVYQTVVSWFWADYGRSRVRDGTVRPFDQADAQAIADAVRRFLVDSGYELARVSAQPMNDWIRLEVNEGRLARVLFRGHGTMETLELQLLLDIPHEVWNRRVVERQMEALRRERGFVHTRYELVALDAFVHSGPELGYAEQDLAAAPALPFELHVTVDTERWDEGLAFEVGYETTRGALIDVGYAGGALLQSDDHWMLGLGLGATSFASLRGGASEVRLSRAALNAKWIGAPWAAGLRPGLDAAIVLDVRQRRDLLLQTYRFFTVTPAADLTYRLSDYVVLALGGGLEYRQLFGIEQLLTEPPLPEQRSFSEGRGFARLELDLTFDPENVRLDRHHRLSLAGTGFVGADLWRVEAAYAKVFELGWHDLWVRSAGGGLLGDVTFVDELALASYLRNLFVHDYWVPWVGTTSLELRYSLRREIFKVGAFLDGAVFGDQGHGRREAGTKVAGATGLGIHTLVLDLLQLDLYYALGVTSDGRFSQGVSLSASKAF